MCPEEWASFSNTITPRRATDPYGGSFSICLLKTTLSLLLPESDISLHSLLAAFLQKHEPTLTRGDGYTLLPFPLKIQTTVLLFLNRSPEAVMSRNADQQTSRAEL